MGGGDKLNYRCISVIMVECKNLSSILLSKLSLYADELLEIVVEYFSVLEQLLIPYLAFVKCWSRNGSASAIYRVAEFPIEFGTHEKFC